MKAILVSFVPGPVEPKRRARHGKTRQGKPVTYSDDRTVAYEAWIATNALRYWNHIVIDQPCALKITAYLRRPKKPKYKDHPGSRPDIDNYIKAAMDGITRAGIWTDDSLVVHVVTEKRWTENHEGLSVSIYEAET